ncbi:MAG: flavin reductase family protein [Actinomycetota bacterium]|nr:flavin reductase family protein [Actinomycetota bacterium]
MAELIDPALFRETLGHYPTGVAVVTAMPAEGQPAGMVVGTFCSVSLDPPLIAFFPARTSGSFEYLRTASAFCVNVLAADQERLCRQLATGGARKFDGVRWRPGPLGSPVLEDAVSWIECTFERVDEAGDHYIVLGRVRELAVARSTLPLLFFQGGYGRFSTGSFIAAPDPELIQAARLAETIRSEIEDLSTDLGLNCGVLVKIRDDAVQVLAANTGSVEEPFPLGHRQPIIPPLGAVFMVDAPPTEVDDWLRRAPDDESLREIYRADLDRVRQWGYSVLASEPGLLERHHAVLSEFERSDRLPRHERAVQKATSELAELFCPDLVPGQRYDIASIVAPIPADVGQPPMAIRLTGLPPSVPTELINSWTDRLTRAAASAGAVMADKRNGNTIENG